LNALIKILLGAVFVIGSIWWVLQGSDQFFNTPRKGINDLITVVNGLLPPFVAVIGLFIVWLELDELKIESELKKEERKPRKK